MRSNLNFSDFIHQRRIGLGYTLREFCRKKGQDTAYISRLENNLIQPPKNQIKLEALATAYEFENDTKEWVDFFDLASVAKGEIPVDLQEKQMVNFLPAFYRSVRQEKITKDDLNKLFRLLQGREDNGKTEDPKGRMDCD